jgi:chromosome segregation ATPase
MSIFKSTSEKLSKRLESLEAEATSLEKRAIDARGAAADAQARLVEDLAEGLDVGKWREARERAEKKAADAERDLLAAREAAGLVSDRLEKTKVDELLQSLRKHYAEAQKDAPGALEDLLASGKAFSATLGRFKALEREADSVYSQLRAAGDKEARYSGLPVVNDALSDALGHDEGRELVTVNVPTWPSRSSS